MEREYEYLIIGLAMVLVAAAAATIAYYSASINTGHGAYVASGMNNNDTILLTGDTPSDEVVPVSDIFSLSQVDVVTLKGRDGVGVHDRGVPVLEFLRAHSVTDFDRLIFYVDNYEVTITRDNITDGTILEPYGYSLRVAGSNLPVNAGVKNVRSIVVVGDDPNSSIRLNGRQVSYGSMLDEGVDTFVYGRMQTGYLADDKEYQIETGYVANGISLRDLLSKEGFADFTNVTVQGGGKGENLTRSKVLEGGFELTRYKGRIMLADTDKLPMQWMNVSSIEVT